MKKYVYGFDLAISTTGISIFDEEGNIEKICSISTDKDETHGLRLKAIADFVFELREKYPPATVIIERAFSRFNTSTAVLYRVHGIINYIFHDVVQIYYAPKAIKAKIVRGDATKKMVREKILSVYKDIEFANDDESDSFAVGIMYFINNGIVEF